MKRSVLWFGFMVLSLCLVATSSFATTHTVTYFQGNKGGALSITFDDGYKTQLQYAIPNLDSRNLKGTLFPIADPGWMSGTGHLNWTDVNTIASYGHEIGSHTVTHPYLTQLSSSQLTYELTQSQAMINTNVPTQSCVSLSYPYGDYNATVESAASLYYIGARSTDFPELNYYTAGPGRTAIDFMNVGSGGIDSTMTPSYFDPYVSDAVTNHAWLSVHFHEIPSASFFASFCDYFLTKNLWIDTFGNIVRYMKERLGSQLTVLADTSSVIRLQLIHSLNPSLFSFPLTIRSTVPSTWAQVSVQQGTSTQTLTTVTEGSDKVVYYSAVPNGGDIVLTSSLGGSNPVPTLTSLSPSSATAGGAAFTLTVTGTNFVNGSVVQWNSANRATTYVSATQLTAAILASDIAIAGAASVKVFNPTPGGGTSNALTFTINAPNPVPAITTISPTSAAAGGAAFTLTVTGTNFINSSVVRWNGGNLTTTYVSSTQLAAAITAADIASAGTATVTVYNPAPGGGTSSGVTFTINNPAPTLTTLSPSSAAPGGAAFTLTVTGTNFISSSVVQWNGSARTTTYVSGTQLTAAITAADIATPGTATVTVSNPTPGGGTSSGVTFTINNPAPTLTSISPNYAAPGGAAFTLTVTGTNFINSSVVRWNGGNRTTTYVSSTQLTAAITAADIASAGTATVTVYNPAPGGGTSSGVTFTINNPAPTLTTLSPSSAAPGGAAFTLTVTGTNFINSSVVRWNGGNRTTTYVSSTQLTAAITAADIASPGTATVTVSNPTPGGGTSSGVTFTINNPAPTLTSISPNYAAPGGAAFTLTVTGTNFISSSVVRWNGSNRTTTYVSSTQLTAAITAADIASAGTATVTVYNPAPGGGTSSGVTFTINNPAPTLTTLSPSSAAPGGAAFTLTVTGTNFINSSVVRWNGGNRTTTYVSSTQLTAAITAADIASPGTATVTVSNPTPGGGTSSGVTFTINNPAPTLTSISPNYAAPGGAAFTLTVTGTNFISSSVVRWNGSNRTTTYVSSTTLTAAITAADIASPGTATVTVSNPTPGGGTSSGVTFTINNPAPTLTSLSPSSATAGGAAFTLTLTGTNFISGSVVRWNGSNRTTTYVSSTTLTAAITAADIATPGTATVTVSNPTPGGGTSSGVTFTINNPAPTLTSISPNYAAPGGAAFSLTVNGSGFVNGVSVVQWNGSARTTTFGSSTQLTAAITAADIATPGTATVTVSNPAPGGGTSSGVTFTINNPAPTLTSVSPTSGAAGGTAFTLTVTGTNFISTSVVQWNGSARTTTYVSGTQLTAAITAADIASPGTATVTVFNPTPGGGTSSGVTFTINNPAPTLTSLSPTSATASGAGFTLTVSGSGFVSGGVSVVRWNGANRTTTFVSSTQLTAAITAADIASAGTATVTVYNPAPGGGTSGGVTFTINNPAPAITTINPTSGTTGGAAFTLTVNGSGFVSGSSVVQWNGSARTTIYVSATQINAAITAADIATTGTATVTVYNPTPGGGTSGGVTFAINAANNPVPAITSISPTSITSGSAAFTLTVTGTNFISSSVVLWNGAARTTTYVSATQLTAAVTAADIATAGSATVTVYNPTPGGGTSGGITFTISAANGTTHQITSFQGNHAAAVSLGFDDGYQTQVTTGLPQLNVRGMKGTYFVITGDDWTSSHVSWPMWQTLAGQGHEIASHTVTHPDLTTLSSADLQYELSASQSTINQQIPSQSCISFAYPNGSVNDTVMAATAAYYFAARVTWSNEGGVLNHYTDGSDVDGSWKKINFYDIGAQGIDLSGATIQPDNLSKILSVAVKRHAWAVFYFHEIQNGTMMGQFLDLIRSNDVWVDTFGTISRYMKERLVSTVQVLQDSTSGITLNIVMDTSSLPTMATYNVPLTLRSTVPSSWALVSVGQGTATQTLTPVKEGPDMVVYYNAVPNGGNIVLTGSTSGNPAPTLTSLNPASATAGGAGFTLTVNGSGFVNGVSVVRWNGANRTTTFVSSTQLTAAILAADIATAGSATVTVFNPTPGGGTSGGIICTINAANNPVPAITSISPTSATAGGAAFTLTVNGTGFVSGISVVRWNGGNRTTTFVSATQLTAAITAADIASAGTATVTVFNPTPGGGTSGSMSFTIIQPPPPAAPSGLSATAISRSQINLAWTDNASNETGFKIERCSGSACTNFTQIATVGAGVQTYSNTGLSKSTAYTYRVRAYNTGGNSAYSNTASATTPQK